MDYWTAKELLGSLFMIYALAMFYNNLRKNRDFEQSISKIDSQSLSRDEIKQIFLQKGYRFDRAENHVMIFKKMQDSLKFFITLCTLLFLAAILVTKLINVTIIESLLGAFSIILTGLILFYFPMQYLLEKLEYRYDLKKKTFTKKFKFK